MILLDVDRNLAGHVAVALAKHRQALRREQVAAPEGLDDLLDAMTSRARSGQGATALDPAADLSQYQPVTAPLLLTKTEAAETLGVSPRSVDRLIADGRLTAVKTGAASVRIRRSDLESFVASLDPVSQSA